MPNFEFAIRKVNISMELRLFADTPSAPYLVLLLIAAFTLGFKTNSNYPNIMANMVEFFKRVYYTSTWIVATIYYGIKALVMAGIRKITGSDSDQRTED